MKKITIENYQTDKFYPRIVRAVSAILSSGDVVAPVEVFVRMQLLESESLTAWKKGSVPFLEKAIKCNLEAASRILRILRMHAHDLNLRPSETSYRRLSKGPAEGLRFTRFHEEGIEKAYATHFVRAKSTPKVIHGEPSGG